ncbi:MAG TPA: Crp/Fnr family transcriptional regulator [Methylomirabilota bacterium]
MATIPHGLPARQRLAADVEILRRVPYFRSLPAAALRELARDCASRALAAGETLFEEGAPCTRLFIIAAGRVEVRQTSLRGREQVFHTEQPGAALGEAPLFDRGGYIASAVAVEASRVLSLPRARLIALCRTHPAVALGIVETLARRVRRFADLVGDLAFRPVPERLARYLVATAGARPLTPGLEVDLQLTQAQLAARLGTVRELVARALAQLDQAGVVSRAGARVVVRDPGRLRALAEGGGE